MNVHKIKINLYDPDIPKIEIGPTGTQLVEAVDFELNSTEWSDLTLLVSFLPSGAETGVSVLYDGEPITIPSEVTSKAGYHKMIISGTRGSKIIKSKLIKLFVSSDTMSPCITPDPEPTPSTYAQVVDMMVKQAVDADAAEAAQLAAEAAKDETQSLRNETEELKDIAVGAAQTATEQADRAAAEADDAEGSKYDAEQSKTAAQQALSDLLEILGQPNGFATLDANGKLSSSQIPLITLTNVVKVSSISEMLALTIGDVQNGDIAQIVVGGVTEETYVLLDDKNIGDINSWTVIRTGYAAEAGHAQTADTASDADRIGGKRIINMTQSQYDNAALVEDYYFVVPDSEV
jgi:hypothetical protein